VKNSRNPFGLIAPDLDAACKELEGAPLTGAQRQKLPEEKDTPSDQIITTVRQIQNPTKPKFTEGLKFVFGSSENLQKLLAGKDGVSLAHIL